VTACAYIAGDDHLERMRAGADLSAITCGKPAIDGSAYCVDHHQVCWVKPKGSRSFGSIVSRAAGAAADRSHHRLEKPIVVGTS
jgi:hypothetical protein